ncbi:MAG: hypothetical protein PHN37_03285 [Candidatus Pacebacteria bacterium]|nr:hypothetical protein [Candidatus Paceibacterota bacterium]
MIVIGGLDDQLGFLVWSKVSNGFFRVGDSYSFYSRFLTDYTHPWQSNQPVWAFALSVFGTIFKENAQLFFVLFTLFLNLYFSYKFFKAYKYGWVYTLLFSFSTFSWVHMGIHLSLSQLWLIPLFLIYLRKITEEASSAKNILQLGIVIAFSVSISNYIGFFNLLYLSFFVFLSFIRYRDIKFIWVYLKVLFISLSLTAFFLFPFFSATYIDSSDRHQNLAGTNYTLKRPYEDFFYFSSRPWYFFTPPVKNPWIGGFGKTMVDKISSTGYFLGLNYFAGEHSANYFGVVFLVTTVVLSFYSFFVKKFPVEEKRRIILLWLTNLIIVSFMMPPFLTLSGLKIYTPGYLVYLLFPMFRVTARLSVFLLFNLLFILSYIISHLHEIYPKKRKFIRYFVVLLVAVTLFETYIPIKIQKHSQPPEVYSFIGESYSKVNLIVYPYNESKKAFFWINVHDSYLINVRDFADDSFESEKFTKELVTKEGFENAVLIENLYLVVNKEASEEDIDFLKEQSTLIYEDDEHVFLKIS